MVEDGSLLFCLLQYKCHCFHVLAQAERQLHLAFHDTGLQKFRWKELRYTNILLECLWLSIRNVGRQVTLKNWISGKDKNNNRKKSNIFRNITTAEAILQLKDLSFWRGDLNMTWTVIRRCLQRYQMCSLCNSWCEDLCSSKCNILQLDCVQRWIPQKIVQLYSILFHCIYVAIIKIYIMQIHCGILNNSTERSIQGSGSLTTFSIGWGEER